MKKNLVNIVNIVLAVLFPIAGIVMALVRLIIKHWDTIKAALVKVFTFVVDKLRAIWGTIVDVVKVIIEKVKQVWNGITGFFAGLWEGIKNIAASAWNGIKDLVSGVVDGIKNVWNGLVSFFSGLWEAIKQGPAAAAIEYIKNAFFGLFENIQNFFFGFIDKIKQGWDTVKGFFSGIGEGIVNLVTGDGEASAAKPVNDLIVTPDGKYSTHPDDYIMAMKNPASIVDALARFLGQGSAQTAYAGVPSGGSLAGSALNGAARQNTYHHATSNVSSVNAPMNVHINTTGMSAEQAQSAIERGVQNALRNIISISRGSIPAGGY